MTPTVNVLVTTYNLEKYIEQCLNAILNQETQYSYRVIIVDDCSKDGTVAVIKEIIKSHPNGNLIDLHVNEENLGVVKNSRKIFGLATAKYIAMCDGDDYWVDMKKLEKQTSFLEQHPEYNSSACIVNAYYQITGKFKIVTDLWYLEKKESYVIRDYLVNSFSQTGSYFFRNHIVFPDWFENLQSNDATLFILATKNGKIKYFKEVMSVYRIHPDNYSSKKKARKSYEKTKYFLTQINKHFDYKYKNTIYIRHLINRIYLLLIDYKPLPLRLVGKALVLFLFLINRNIIKN